MRGRQGVKVQESMIIKRLDSDDNLRSIFIIIFAGIFATINMYSLSYPMIGGNPMSEKVLGIVALIWIFSMFSTWIILKK